MSEEKQIPERHRKRYESAIACRCSECKALIPILEELGATENVATDLQTENGMLQAQLAVAKQETEGYRQQARQLDDEFEECQAQLAAVTKEQDDWKAESFAGKQIYSQYRHEAREEFRRYQSEVDKLQAENASLREDREATENEVQRLFQLVQTVRSLYLHHDEHLIVPTTDAALKDRP